jgi:hypothetical protein
MQEKLKADGRSLSAKTRLDISMVKVHHISNYLLVRLSLDRFSLPSI